MKKILILCNLLLLAVIFFLSCNHDDIKKADEALWEKQCKNKLCGDYEAGSWSGKINAVFARQIADNYQKDIAKNFIWRDGNNTGSEDARSIWFSLETIKKFIWIIESNQCKKNCRDSLGIRIYYARYPEAKDPIWKTPGLAPEARYAGHHTVFMIPTYWDPRDSMHHDFDPMSRICRGPFDTSATAKPTTIFFEFTGDPDGQNHGNLIPPDLNSGNAF
ncbi:hypothetical protein [Ferruginibacter sp.]